MKSNGNALAQKHYETAILALCLHFNSLYFINLSGFVRLCRCLDINSPFSKTEFSAKIVDCENIMRRFTLFAIHLRHPLSFSRSCFVIWCGANQMLNNSFMNSLSRLSSDSIYIHRDSETIMLDRKSKAPLSIYSHHFPTLWFRRRLEIFFLFLFTLCYFLSFSFFHTILPRKIPSSIFVHAVSLGRKRSAVSRAALSIFKLYYNFSTVFVTWFTHSPIPSASRKCWGTSARKRTKWSDNIVKQWQYQNQEKRDNVLK